MDFVGSVLLPKGVCLRNLAKAKAESLRALASLAKTQAERSALIDIYIYFFI